MSNKDWEKLSDEEKLKDIKDRWQKYIDIKDRSKKRSKEDKYSSSGKYYLLNNFKGELGDGVDISFGRIQIIKDPPDITSLTDSLNNKYKYLSGEIIGYTHEAKYELFIPEEENPKVLSFFSSLLRIKTGENFIISYGASKSWSTIMGADKSSVDIYPVEEVGKVWKFGNRSGIQIEDLQWMDANKSIFETLYKDDRFYTAVESYTTFNHIVNLRMSTALIWAGIESLFEISSEISFRLSITIASFLYDRGTERYDFYTEFKKLYSFRSKAVHGVKLEKEKIINHLDKVKDIFREVLQKIITNGRLPSKKDFEMNIFL